MGFDPTAASLHLGHLMQVVTARRLQLAGHRPLLLVGGATGQIGDPKETTERSLNPPEVVAAWVENIRGQLAPFVTYNGDNAATLVNNLEWTGPMSVIEFLRDVGKHFPVNRMLAREVVRARLETGISFTEFSYQLLQSHDFFELHRRHGCTLQFGGSDQWGNITAGVDYVRRRGGGPVHAFVTPLVTKADGTKFGKTEGGSLWLDAEMTSPYAFYQFWVNVDDADVMSLPEVLQLPFPGRADRAGGGDADASGRPRGPAGVGRGADHPGARRGGDAPRSSPPARRCSAVGRWPSSTRRRCAPRWPRPVSCRSRPRCRPWPNLLKESGLVGEPERGSPHDRRGRSLRQQRTGRPTRQRSSTPPPCCTENGWCCGADGVMSPGLSSPTEEPSWWRSGRPRPTRT